MADDVDAASARFWNWFTAQEGKLRSDFLAAATRRDYPALQKLVEKISVEVHRISTALSVRLNGGEAGFQLAILSPDPGTHALAQRILARAPALAAWKIGEDVDSPPANVIVRDAAGRELVIAYADVTFLIAPAEAAGAHQILFSIAEEFDPRGERGHLYQAAATELIKNTFGAPPPGLASYALVPGSWISPRPTTPVRELAAAWRTRAT